MTTTAITPRFTRLVVAAAAVALVLSGCSTASPAATTTATQADSLSISDTWVKTVDSGMSAAFGVLTNSGSTDINVVAASSDASPMIQLHETVEDGAGGMKMQEKKGGFIIPAGGSFTLEPGGNHIMLMDVAAPIKAGDEVSFVLQLADGSTLPFTAAAKDFTGANEKYSTEAPMDMGN